MSGELGSRQPQRSVQEIQNEVFAPPFIHANLGSISRGVIKDKAGKVRAFTCFNDNSTRRFFQFHNTSAVPSDGDTPADVWFIPPNAQVVIGTDYFGQLGNKYTEGISFVFSVSANQAVSAAAADCTAFTKYI